MTAEEGAMVAKEPVWLDGVALWLATDDDADTVATFIQRLKENPATRAALLRELGAEDLPVDTYDCETRVWVAAGGFWDTAVRRYFVVPAEQPEAKK